MMECLTTTIGYETIESAYMYVLANLFTYSESLVIWTSIIWILDNPDHKVTLHVTRGLCNYRTNAHTQSVQFQSHACFLCLKMVEST